MFTSLIKETGWKCEEYGAGLCWWTVVTGWWTRMVFCVKIRWKTALRKGRPGCGQLEQDFDGQGALMEVRWAASHG